MTATSTPVVTITTALSALQLQTVSEESSGGDQWTVYVAELVTRLDIHFSLAGASGSGRTVVKPRVVPVPVAAQPV